MPRWVRAYIVIVLPLPAQQRVYCCVYSLATTSSISRCCWRNKQTPPCVDIIGTLFLHCRHELPSSFPDSSPTNYNTPPTPTGVDTYFTMCQQPWFDWYVHSPQIVKGGQPLAISHLKHGTIYYLTAVSILYNVERKTQFSKCGTTLHGFRRPQN